MVRSISVLAVVFALTSWTLIKEQSQAQDQSRDISASTTPKVTVLAQVEPKPKPRKPAAGRIPNGWGKLGLSPEQKKNIYKIQGEFKLEIEDLEKQIEDLKAKELEEMEGVLSAEQLAKLKAQDKSPKGKSDGENSGAKAEQSTNSK